MSEKFTGGSSGGNNSDFFESEDINQVVNYLNQHGAEVPNQPVKRLDAYADFLVDQEYVGLEKIELEEGQWADLKQEDDNMEDVKRLTVIYKKHRANDGLDKDDLAFLYQIHRPLQGFKSKKKDHLIRKVLKNRDPVDDLNYIFDGKESVEGDLRLNFLTYADGLTLPNSVNGTLNLGSLYKSTGLEMPQTVDGDLVLDFLGTAKDLKLPQHIGGSLYLGNLKSADGLKLPPSVGGSLFLDSLMFAKELSLPHTVGGCVYMGSLRVANGIRMPKSVGGNLILQSLRSSRELILPEYIGGFLRLPSINTVRNN